jgi:glycerophosphoryl diester phosphodiesterase
VTTIETDMAVTRDDVIVISHDPFLNPDLVRDPEGHWLTGKGPPIRTLTLAELRRYDVGRANPASKYAQQFPEQRPADGERFPRLAELFVLGKASGKPVRFQHRDQDHAHERRGHPRCRDVRAARRRGCARCRRDRPRDCRVFRLAHAPGSERLAPEIETSCITMQTKSNDTVSDVDGAASPWHAGLALRDHGGSLPATVKAAGCSVWSMFWRNLTSRELAEAHALGLKVLPWTVNDPSEMRRLIELGVDGIVTDYPDRLRAVTSEKKMALP